MYLLKSHRPKIVRDSRVAKNTLKDIDKYLGGGGANCQGAVRLAWVFGFLYDATSCMKFVNAILWSG